MLSRNSKIVPYIRSSVRFINSDAYTSSLIGLKKDLKQAMISKDETKKTTIRSILSSIKNMELDNQGKDFNELTLFDLYSKLIKQRTDSINEFIKNDRSDLVTKEENEMSIIKSYLSQLPVSSQEEIDAKVLELLNKIKDEQGDKVQLRDVLKTINFKILPVQWKTSRGVIATTISKKYRDVFSV